MSSVLGSLEEELERRCRLADISRVLAGRARISGQPGDDVNFIPLPGKKTYCSQVRALSAALLDTTAPALAVAEQISAEDAVDIIQANQNERALELIALEEEAGASFRAQVRAREGPAVDSGDHDPHKAKRIEKLYFSHKIE